MRGRLDSAEVVKVIRTEHLQGEGTPESIARIVVTYWSLDGERLAVVDPYENEGTRTLREATA